MKNRRFVTLFASIPVIAAILAIQSCGGVGGPTTSAGGFGSVTELFLALLSDDQRTASYLTPTECANCHGGIDPDTHYGKWIGTEHADNGVTCEGCHGPGSVHKANPSAGNILKQPKVSNPVVCAQCHGPIYDEYTFSKHVEIVSYPVGRGIGNPEGERSSRCSACHSGNMRVRTYEAGVDWATMPADDIVQFAQDALEFVPHTATCATCHDPHGKTGKLTDENEDVQLRHATFSTDTGPTGPGTDPESYQTFDHICAQCHNGRGNDPGDAKLTESTSRFGGHHSNQFNMLLGFAGVEGSGPVSNNTAHANIPGQCSHCHMPDSRHSFTVSFSACVPCHTEVDAANRVTSIKSEILNSMYALRVRLSNWSIAEFPGVPGNETMWEYTSYIEDPGVNPGQENIPIEIKRARHNYHFILESGDYGVHNGLYAKHLLLVANENLDDIGALMPDRLMTVSEAQMAAVLEADRARSVQADIDEID